MSRVTPNGSRSYRKVIYVPKDPKQPPTLRYVCNQCEISVGREGDIGRHMTTHSDTFEFICMESGCWQVGGGVGFHQRGNLMTHLRDAHSPKNQYPCPHVWSHGGGREERCPARFKSDTSLTSHCRRAHGLGSSPSNADTPTLVGTVFAAGQQRRGRGRRPQSNGAFIEFPIGLPDDDMTEATFVKNTFANRQELERILNAQEVQFPTLQFKWPQGSSRHRMANDKTEHSSPQSTPTPSISISISKSPSPSSETAGQSPVVVPLAAVQATYGQPLPHPFTTNAPTLPTIPTTSAFPAAHQLGQQDAILNASPPAWSPTLFQPFASGSGSVIAQPQPAFGQGMAMAGGSMVAPQAANQAYGLTNAPPTPARWTWQANAPPVPSHWTQTNVPLVLPQANASPMPPHWARANAGYLTGGGLMGPIAPLALPFAGGLDLGDPFNTSFNSFNPGSVPSSLPRPRFNNAGLGASMPPLRAESHVFSARSQTTFAPAPAPAPAPVPTASEPYALQVPLEVSNFVHWSVRHGPSAL